MVWKKLVGLFRRSEARPSHGAPSLDEQLDELRGYIARDLRGGFVDADSIIDNALEVLELQPHGEDVLRAHARRILDDETEAYRHESAGWPETTDHDRLEQAFAALETQGVVCRQNFTCCGTCGVAEIGDEIDAVRERGMPVQGYAFFHMQDTECAVEGGGLWLNYGATEAGETPALAVGHRIADALRLAGLAVNWDGDWAKRIHVPLQWQRRLAL
ncbi:DUF6891 domain-containing protein [Lysobacter arvi]|uniref:DUF6891 domain-containing protein n=1 Tax=Lysobacter arvi TaxID=3038776 RepID=A0ABU1CEC5_9GAMM|nr:hypothetical protein [Lysobacter arvi]MDR0182467.1 hypothetical protein [Lysobacter arvi]